MDRYVELAIVVFQFLGAVMVLSTAIVERQSGDASAKKKNAA